MRTVLSALLTLLLACMVRNAAAATTDARAGIATFNRAFAQSTRTMDNRAALALWEDDGISLLPSTPPIMGKNAIGKFLDDFHKKYPGARMRAFESQCFDIQVSGNLATEWCTEHQLVKLSPDKPPFDGHGKMLLVLHRDKDGRWRLRQEMWNQAVAPDAATH